MTSSTKRRLAWRIGAVLGAAAASATLAASAASANSDVTSPARITVPGNAAAAPAVLIASLEGRNEVASGATAGQALELIGLQGNTLSYSVTWRGIGTPTEADIHAGVRGVDGPVVVPLFTTPSPGGWFRVRQRHGHRPDPAGRVALGSWWLLHRPAHHQVPGRGGAGPAAPTQPPGRY